MAILNDNMGRIMQVAFVLFHYRPGTGYLYTRKSRFYPSLLPFIEEEGSDMDIKTARGVVGRAWPRLDSVKLAVFGQLSRSCVVIKWVGFPGKPVVKPSVKPAVKPLVKPPCRENMLNPP